MLKRERGEKKRPMKTKRPRRKMGGVKRQRRKREKINDTIRETEVIMKLRDRAAGVSFCYDPSRLLYEPTLL